VAELDAVASSMPPGEEPSEAVKHALAELQQDIQEVGGQKGFALQFSLLL
jgi:hypothetical protein